MALNEKYWTLFWTTAKIKEMTVCRKYINDITERTTGLNTRTRDQTGLSSEFRICMKVEVAALGITVCTISKDVKQH